MEGQSLNQDPLVSDHLKWIYERLPEQARVREAERLHRLFLETGAKIIAINQAGGEDELTIPTQDT